MGTSPLDIDGDLTHLCMAFIQVDNLDIEAILLDLRFMNGDVVQDASSGQLMILAVFVVYL